ncbi:MAG: LysR family transcriptional regulator [Magnetococcales bacterium]|nr:LysR family transcriptional regulator [Magnetococcales bacterium]
MHSSKTTLHKVDLNLLVAFDVLMTEQSVTHAGRALGITQAAMSNTLKRLRLTFNDPLFIKQGHIMAPTAKALQLAATVRKALAHTQSLLNRESFHPATTHRQFRIAISECVASIIVPPLVNTLRQIAPHISLDVLVPGEDGHSKILERGDADLLITWFPWVTSGKLHLHRLYEMNCVCLASPDNAHVGERLTLENFIAADHIQFLPQGLSSTLVDEALLQLGYTRKIMGRFNNSSLVATMVATSDLLTVLPDRYAHFLAKKMNLRVHPLPFEVMPLRIAMAWHARNHESVADQWLRKVIIELVELADPENPIR